MARGRHIRRFLAAADVAAVALVLAAAKVLTGADPRPLAIVLLPLAVLAGEVLGLAGRDQLVLRRTTLEELPRVAQAAVLFTALAWLLEPWLLEAPLDRLGYVVLGLVMFAAATACRALARYASLRVGAPERCVLVADPETAGWLTDKIRDHAVNTEVLGHVHTDLWGKRAEAYDELRAVVEGFQVHRLIISSDERDPAALLDLLRAVRGLGVRVSIVPRLLEVLGPSLLVEDLGGVPVLGVHGFGLSPSARAVKRAFDLVLAGLGLVVCAPLLALIAVLVKLDSPGPVFFRQTRVGHGGQLFNILKFRTMDVDAEHRLDDLAHLNEADGLFKIADDPRITRVGRWLRRTAVDELPQLLNVVRGEMSLVGPRPLVVDEDARVTGFDRGRLSLEPGMTGPWQILGSARIPLSEMLLIDYRYVAGWSLWGDLKILLRTVPFMLARRGA